MSLFFILAEELSQLDTDPQMQSVSVARFHAGACGTLTANPSASITVSWSATNFDSSLHIYKVYQDGVLLVTQATTNMVKTISGYVENGPGVRMRANWVFRVDLCEIDGTVLATASSAPWTQNYATCLGPGTQT